MQGKLSDKDRLAIYYNLSCGYSQVKAYKKSHPNTTDECSIAYAYRYFKRVMAVFDTLPFKVKLKICDLDENRVLKELSDRMQATTKVFYQGVKVAEVPDNKTRMDATTLLTRINGVDKSVENNVENQDNTIKIEITENDV